ncbi:efflux RND transporter permease subunit [Massilia scottii]|uniref:efflux RND transporter permease subunit n=1 Tax=Massilia scottii TaxID=3057166 RepID=UPI002796C03B|nr:MMPL family transporter [Massilia sp. CCM 9029]MDQ1829150.1 MMPL family transporter [Massilia sp. CCM 9029]
MKRLMNTLIAYFGNVPDQLRKRKYVVWLFFVLATAFMFAGLGRAKFDASIEGWFEADDPTIVAFDWFHHEFGSDDHLYIVYKPKDGNVFSEASLKTLKAMQDELAAKVAAVKEGDSSPLNHVVKVTSLINAPVLRAEQDALISKKLVGNTVPGTQAELDEIRKVALSQKSFPLLYFSKDNKYGGIMVETNFGAIPVVSAGATSDLAFSELKFDDPGAVAMEHRPKFKPTDMPDYIALMDAVKSVLHKPAYTQHVEYFPVGSTAMAEFNWAMVMEMGMLNVAALCIITLLLWFLFRSLSAVVWPVVIVILSVIWMTGITAWLGLPITSFVMIAVMLTLAVGVADTVHVLAGYLSARKEGKDHAAALRTGFRHVAVACLLTSVINIVAVLALSVTPVVPIKVFALMCALGVALPFMFSVYLLPLMLDIWAPKHAGQTPRAGLAAAVGRLIPNFAGFVARQLDKVLPVVEKRPVTFIAMFVSLFAVCVYGSMLTKVDTDPVGSFPLDSPIRRNVQVVDQNMMGAQSMEIFLDLGKDNAFHDPFVLQTVEQLQRTIEGKYGHLVVKTTSLVDTVKHSYKTLNEGREEMYIIPDKEATVSQTLFLFNQSNPDDRRKLVSDNFDKSHISVRLYNAGSYEYAKTWEAMRKDINQSVGTLRGKYPTAEVSITGVLALMMQGADYLTRSELQSFGLALILISVILLMLFGSVKAGAIALIPNLIPAILAYGALGLLGKPLDITTMMIAPIIIGIAVDDTVHFIMRYRNEVIIDGNIRRALHTTITDTGQSIVFTTMILGLGFGVMAFASGTGMANLGLFGSMAILIGLLNDLFFLPAMILVFKLKFSTRDAAPSALVAPALAPASAD